jgi:hypothetical protein
MRSPRNAEPATRDRANPLPLHAAHSRSRAQLYRFPLQQLLQVKLRDGSPKTAEIEQPVPNDSLRTIGHVYVYVYVYVYGVGGTPNP